MFFQFYKEIQPVLDKERLLYLGENQAQEKQMRQSNNRRYLIWEYLVSFRKCQYWRRVRENRKSSWLQRHLAKYLQRHYDRERNLLSERCHVEIGIDSHIGAGVNIWHGGIVINGNLGEDCIIHGNTIIGNKGIGREDEYPTLGNRVDVGVGANIIGKVFVADDCVIGAGALVLKDFTTAKSIIVGNPARLLATSVKLNK